MAGAAGGNRFAIGLVNVSLRLVPYCDKSQLLVQEMVMIVRIFAGSIVALGLGLMAEGAEASQTFMCDDGRMLQLESNEIQRMKYTDACVAAHYGVDIHHVPLPVQRPTSSLATQSLELKGTRKANTARNPMPQMADAKVDYRNIPIINALPGSQSWFRHNQ